MEPDFLSHLAQIVGPAHVSSGRPERTVYSYDASLVESTPGAVVFPADTRETAAVVQAAVKAGVAFVPRGFGTNLSGGSIAPPDGLVIGLARLNRILRVNLASRRAIVQPGVTNLELQNALASFGYFYAPDPASQKVATLGGNAAENSGGPRCLKYGVTTNHILGLTVVTHDGKIVTLGGPTGDMPGLDLRGLFIGSEGTLGLVTELTVKILPKPETVKTMLVIYDDVRAAALTVSDIIAAGIVPAALEMMDQPVIQAIEASTPCGYPQDAAAVLIIEVEGPAAGLESQVDAIQRLCRANHCRAINIAHNDQERDKLWSGRRGAFGAVARIASRYLVADCTVPRTRLPDALSAVSDIVQKYDLSAGNVFHAGDGNLHPLIFFNPRLAGQSDLVHQAGFEVMRACVAMGGTISGEHGIGLEKRQAMRLVFTDDDLTAMRAIKIALDPLDRLNPGKIIPPDVPVDVDVAEPLGNFSDTPFFQPAHDEEASDMVRWAYHHQTSLLPLGHAFLPDFGNRDAAPPVELRSTRMNDILEYDPENQFITVQAGMAVSRLLTELASHRQWLPHRPLLSGSMTVGGLVALGLTGPERLAYGAVRDFLLGLKFISGTGRLISGGGKVVKNVAGYDLTRLVAGSAGTLGLITQVTFRLVQIPEKLVALTAEGSLDACRDTTRLLLDSQTEPAAMSAQRINGHSWRLIVAFEGLADSVQVRQKQASTFFDRAKLESPTLIQYSPNKSPWGDAYEPIYYRPFVMRVDLANELIPGFLADIRHRIDFPHVIADLGVGRILAGLDELSHAGWSYLCDRATQADGRITLEKAPPSFKENHDVFGPAQPVWPLIHRVKSALDPKNVFVPGRLPGRI